MIITKRNGEKVNILRNSLVGACWYLKLFSSKIADIRYNFWADNLKSGLTEFWHCQHGWLTAKKLNFQPWYYNSANIMWLWTISNVLNVVVTETRPTWNGCARGLRF